LVSYILLDGEPVIKPQTPSSGFSSRTSKQIMEDDECFYEYPRNWRGEAPVCRPKTGLQKYASWHRDNVEFTELTSSSKVGKKRLTPLTEFEKQIGVKKSIETYRYDWCIRPRYGCQERTFTKDEWKIFRQTHTIDYGNVVEIHKLDFPKSLGRGQYDWNTYFTDKANELNLEIVNLSDLVFREKQKPAVVEKVRPNPKEVEKVRTVEVVPIKEVEKYSPLIIAGVIAVVVILLLKRRRA